MYLAYGNMNSFCTIALLCYYIFLQLTTKPRPTYYFRHCTNRYISDIKLFFSVICKGILQQTKGLYKVCSIDFLRQRGYFTKRSITGIFQFAEMKTQVRLIVWDHPGSEKTELCSFPFSSLISLISAYLYTHKHKGISTCIFAEYLDRRKFDLDAR